MNALIIALIVLSCASNVVADIYLMSGKTKVPGQTHRDRIDRTPLNHLMISGILGLVSILFWLTPAYYLAQLPGTAGALALLFFAAYIASLTTFHVMCAYALMCYKFSEEALPTVGKSIRMYGLVCMATSGLYTASMLFLSYSGALHISLLQALTLPFFSILIVQKLLGRVFHKVHHFSSVAGTLSMLVSLLGTVWIMIENLG